jgi:hypothetical protein
MFPLRSGLGRVRRMGPSVIFGTSDSTKKNRLDSTNNGYKNNYSRDMIGM